MDNQNTQDNIIYNILVQLYQENDLNNEEILYRIKEKYTDLINHDDNLKEIFYMILIILVFCRKTCALEIFKIDETNRYNIITKPTGDNLLDIFYFMSDKFNSYSNYDYYEKYLPIFFTKLNFSAQDHLNSCIMKIVKDPNFSDKSYDIINITKKTINICMMHGADIYKKEFYIAPIEHLEKLDQVYNTDFTNYALGLLSLEHKDPGYL